MEREIKFQFIIDGKKLSKPYTCDCQLNESRNHCEGDCLKYEYSKITGKRQYTGLKDKNGIEIYEGDILSMLRHEDENNWASQKIHKKDYYEIVSFKNGCFITDRGISVYESIKDIVHHHHFTEFEIIGNIFENKELLHS